MSATVRKTNGSRGSKAPVLQLVPRGRNPDSIYSRNTGDALRELARQADEGELVGFGFAAIHRDRSKDFVCTAGAANSCPERVVFWLHRLIVSLIRN